MRTLKDTGSLSPGVKRPSTLNSTSPVSGPRSGKRLLSFFPKIMVTTSSAVDLSDWFFRHALPVAKDHHPIANLEDFLKTVRDVDDAAAFGGE